MLLRDGLIDELTDGLKMASVDNLSVHVKYQKISKNAVHRRIKASKHIVYSRIKAKPCSKHRHKDARI